MTCKDDCADDFKEAVCGCAIKNGLCGETCQAVIDLGPECSIYGNHNDICGGLMDFDAVYRDICDGCPPGTIIFWIDPKLSSI